VKFRHFEIFGDLIVVLLKDRDELSALPRISAAQVSKTLSYYEIALRDQTPRISHFFTTLRLSQIERRLMVCCSSLTAYGLSMESDGLSID
jgi:ABC-type glycerol-3-phosphate transport system permease component